MKSAASTCSIQLYKDNIPFLVEPQDVKNLSFGNLPLLRKTLRHQTTSFANKDSFII